ncbi:MAG: DUF2490 domain-containing protein [Saprospiraceae bacterium]|nr:DUF2490 domain-containing protein [Saprospiraceae bacterium]
MKKFILLSMIFVFDAISLVSQNTRITDENNIFWKALNVNYKIHANWVINTEYQWRRADGINSWQQSLLRLGSHYNINTKLSFRLLYAWAETYPYGDYSINSLGRDFTEHRLAQAFVLTDNMKSFQVSHRLMLEQRWVGRYLDTASVNEDDYFFVNRMRYLLRVNYFLSQERSILKDIYLGAQNEILIGFGKNVNENVFDQNRSLLCLGYRLNSKFRVEVGYLIQILQLGREVNQRNVFQYNRGLSIGTTLNIGKS